MDSGLPGSDPFAQSTDLDGQFTTFLDTWINEAGLSVTGPNSASDQTRAQMPSPAVVSAQNLEHWASEALKFSTPMDTTDQALPLDADTRSYSGLSRNSTGSREREVPATGDRKTKVLEKNRRAQKRFREKQKTKMSDMEAQVDALRQTMEEMSVEKVCLERQNEVLNKVLELRQSQIEVLTETARLQDSSADADDVGIKNSGLEVYGTTKGPTIDQCRHMERKAIIATWKAYVEKIAVKLVTLEMPNPSDQEVSELEALACEAGAFAQNVAIVNPSGIKELVLCNLETGSWDENMKNNPKYWVNAIESIELTEAQKDKIMYIAKILQTAVRRLGEERTQLAKELNTYLPLTCGSCRSLAACVKVTGVMDSMQKNFQNEHTQWTSFHAAVLGKVLTPLQMARFATNAYPMFPNAFAVVTNITSSGYASTQAGLELTIVSCTNQTATDLQMVAAASNTP